LVYRNPRRKEERQKRHFTEEWTETRSALLGEYRTKNLSTIVNWLLTRFPHPGAILDVGSSYGNLLSQFPETWERYGVEPSATASQISQSHLPGANIIRGILADANLPENSFNVVTIVDTIYYLHNPLRDLRRLPSLLKPGGIVLLEAQNFSNRGIVYRLMGRSFDDTWMYFYTPATLKNLLTKAGLKVVGRLDLPGHQVGSQKFLKQFVTWSEFYLLKALKKISAGKLDLAPHFVLVAQRV
jgi:SAM-dependent methyltransferase